MNYTLFDLTKNSIIKKLIASILIVSLTMVNFILVGIETVSYAADAFEVGTPTNNKNVTFDSYFKDAEGKIISEKEEKIDSNDMKLFVHISVKNEGYFNGTISLENSNFRFNNKLMNPSINKIEGNTITLNQINSGEAVEIAIGIEPIREETINSRLLNMQSEILINGVYRNSKEKDIKISATRAVQLNLISPYEENEGIELSSYVITNKVYNINGENKRIVQLLVESGLKDNSYPVKENNLEISVPSEVEKVNVISRGILSSNGKSEVQFSSDDWSYVEKDHKINVSIKNEINNGTIKWLKSGKDKIIVTYVMNENADIQNNEISVKNNVTMYDAYATVKEANATLSIESELDGVITSGIELQENSLYKGKIYSNEDRDYKTVTNIYVNEAETAKNINMEILPSKYQTVNGELNSNIQFKNTIINKENVLRILGEDGTLKLEATDGNILAEITKNTEADENGNIIVNYAEGVYSIKVETSNVVNTGTISLNNTKTIKQDLNSRDVKATYAEIVERFSEATAKIELKESTTIANLQTNKTSLSTIKENMGVELIATLKTNGEETELYKNPNIKIQLPPQIENVKLNSVNLLYEDELQITGANIIDENGVKAIVVSLAGEQTKHKDGNVEGATVIINANLSLNKKATNSNEKFSMTCINQNVGIVNFEQPIEVVSPRGMVTVNSINDYGMSAIGDEEEKTSKLELGAESKATKVDIEVINNDEEAVNNVRILGEFPTKNTTNTIETKVTELEVTGADAKVYYTENENATDNIEDASNGWDENINNNSQVKKYLITVDNMEKAQDLSATYNVDIPDNLQYNEQFSEGYKVLYSNANTTNELEATTLALSTGKGPELKATMKAKSGNAELSDGAEIAQGEILKYEIIVENTGTETATNAKISSKIPEGTIYIEPKENFVYEDGYYNELPDKKDVTFDIESLAAGESITKSFEVKVTKNAQENSEIENKASVNYGEATTESNSIKAKVVEGNINVIVKRASDLQDETYRGDFISYFIIVENISDKLQKDVSVNINLPEELELIIVETEKNGENEVLETSKNVNLGDIEAGNKKVIYIQTKIGTIKDKNIKDVSISATVKAKDSKEIKSNEYIENIKDILLNISLSANSENSYLKTGDVIEYTIKIKNESDVDSKLIEVLDEIPEQLTIESVTIDGQEQDLEENNSVLFMQNIQSNNTLEAKVKTVVDYDETRTEPTVITNVARIYDGSDVLYTSEEITHILQAETIDDDTIDSPEDPENPNDPDKNDEDKKNSTGIISGIAWLDENQNGERDSNEELLEGINVRLIDKSGNTVKTSSEKEIAATTNNKGLYILSDVPQGEYLVIFDYDTSAYATTAYKKAGVTDSKNSDAILKQITVNGEQKTLGVTDLIELKENGVSNIDLGLMNATKFDLELNKYISKIVVQTSKETKTYNYDKTTLAKAEIAAKQLQGATVIIEYQIEVRNAGEVAGYIKNIVDYMPSGLKFSSELNKDWYQSGSNLYNESLTNIKLEAGETRTIPLTLTKTMTEENTGLVNNKAEIAESYNEAGIKDIDSTAGNKVQNEDDMGSADVIISVKTGAMITYVSLTLAVIMIIGAGAYLVKRKIDNENNIEVNF